MAGHIATAKATNWTTPRFVLDAVEKVFGGPIALDPCSNPESTVGAKVNYRLPETNGLKASWNYPTIFVNPPYGRSYLHEPCNNLVDALGKDDPQRAAGFAFLCPHCGALLRRREVAGSSIANWVQNCYAAREAYGSEVIGLIPAATGTAHFHDYIWLQATSICFVRGRLKFEGAPSAERTREANVAPHDSCLPYWGKFPDRFHEEFSKIGYVVRL